MRNTKIDDADSCKEQKKSMVTVHCFEYLNSGTESLMDGGDNE